MDADTRELFERSLAHATEQHSGAALDAELVELGWVDALAIEPRAAIATLFELQGTANVTSAALGRVVADAVGLDGTVVLPPIDQVSAPANLEGTELRVDGLQVDGLSQGDPTWVVAAGAEGAVAYRLEDIVWHRRPIGGLDPDLGLVQVIGAGPVPATAGPAGDWDSAVARAQLALGHELVGASRRMLELARQHTLERIQFGRPIGSFQAVRHRLAEALVAIETAEAMLDAAWLDGTPLTAAMAKAVAGRGARTTARHSQQVLAGIGFTTEHPLHRYIRRTLVLDGLFASSRSLTRDLGTDLIGRRQLPPLLPL